MAVDKDISNAGGDADGILNELTEAERSVTEHDKPSDADVTEDAPGQEDVEDADRDTSTVEERQDVAKETVDQEELAAEEVEPKEPNPGYLRNLTTAIGRSPVTYQVLVGGSSGLMTGIVCGRMGKEAGYTAASTCLLLHVAIRRDWLFVNWPKMHKDIHEAPMKFSDKDNLGLVPRVINGVYEFSKDNALLAIAFGGGVFVGLSIA